MDANASTNSNETIDAKDIKLQDFIEYTDSNDLIFSIYNISKVRNPNNLIDS